VFFLPATKEYLITIFKLCSLFTLSVYLWAFCWKSCDSTANGCKMAVHETLCNFFLENSVLLLLSTKRIKVA